MHTKARQTSKNNEKAVKLALCLIKTRILRLVREQIQNKLSRMTDHTVGKLESLQTLTNYKMRRNGQSN